MIKPSADADKLLLSILNSGNYGESLRTIQAAFNHVRSHAYGEMLAQLNRSETIATTKLHEEPFTKKVVLAVLTPLKKFCVMMGEIPHE